LKNVKVRGWLVSLLPSSRVYEVAKWEAVHKSAGLYDVIEWAVRARRAYGLRKATLIGCIHEGYKALPAAPEFTDPNHEIVKSDVQPNLEY
jgi:hypothetical protein